MSGVKRLETMVYEGDFEEVQESGVREEYCRSSIGVMYKYTYIYIHTTLPPFMTSGPGGWTCLTT